MSWFRRRPTIKEPKLPPPPKSSPSAERRLREIKEAVRPPKQSDKKS